jgi:uncharacterized protein (TIGR02145 family)
MVENLNFDASGSRCYDNDPGNCQRYGRLYDWNTALSVCPKGWHLPSDAEWDILTAFAGGRAAAGKKLKAVSGWNEGSFGDSNGTDDFGFSALPGGGSVSSGYFGGVGDSGSWWSATKGSANDAWYQYMDSRNNVFSYDNDKSVLFSVRCLKD